MDAQLFLGLFLAPGVGKVLAAAVESASPLSAAGCNDDTWLMTAGATYLQILV